MAYPSDLDSFTPKVDNVDDIMANDVNELQTAIASLEVKLGVDGSAVITSIDYRLGALESLVDQDVSSGASPTFDGVNITGIVTGTVEQTFLNVRKASAGTISAGRPVYLVSWNASGYAEVEEADASDSGKMPAIGITTTTTTNTATVKIATSGQITGLATDSWAVGADLYVGAGGNLTDTKPTGTNLIQKMAEVVRSNVSTGVIIVFGAGRSNDIPNIAEGNVWKGDASGVAVAFDLDGALSAIVSWDGVVDADVDTVSNLEVDNLKAGVLETSITDNDTKIPSSGAVVDYAQPVNAVLTTIVGLSPSNDDILQLKSGAWTNRTMAQLKTDLSLSASDVGLGNVTNDAQIAKSIGTTKGDIVVFSASGTPIRLAVGTNDQVLTADSGEASGVKWADAGGGGNVAGGSLSDMSNDAYLSGSETDYQAITGLGFQPKEVQVWFGSRKIVGSSFSGQNGYIIKTGTSVAVCSGASSMSFVESGSSITISVDGVTQGVLTIDSLDADGFTIKVVWTSNGGDRRVEFRSMVYSARG